MLFRGKITEAFGLGRRRKLFVRLVFAVTVLTVLGVFYFLNDGAPVGYSELENGVLEEDLARSEYTSNGYLVWSPSCRIPDVDPWHESVRPLIQRERPVACSSLPPLTRLVGRALEVVGVHVHLYAGGRPMWCCYQEISRWDGRDGKNPDNFYSLGECVSFNISVPITLSEHQQFIFVKCFVSVMWLVNQEVYANGHAVISMREDVEKKLRRDEKTKRTRLSVLIVGIDSVSRLNALRAMPETIKYLNDTGWIELKGYNKIGDNTFPNLMAVLTGLDIDQVRRTCMITNKHPLDSCPFVWNHFAEEGYVTAYGEDEPNDMGTFTLEKAGFYKTPVDYYLRPFMLALEEMTKITRKDKLNVCLGPTPATEYIYKYAADFALTFRDHPSFGLFWMNSQSHNSVNSVSAMDSQTRSFLEEITAKGVLNNTLVLFMSDHGMRFGKIRETYVGWLEERLPMVRVWVPEWFRTQHPRLYADLAANGDRLTSPYDLHLTLRHLASGERPTGGAPACPSCVSLLDEVPWNRSCRDAGVTQHWCTCSEYRAVPADGGSVRSAAEFAVAEINALLADGQDRTDGHAECAQLALGRVLTARSKVCQRETGHGEYVISFETLPGRALFEATVGDSGGFKLFGTVSRINAYGSQSKCMNDAILKKYCFCIT